MNAFGPVNPYEMQKYSDMASYGLDPTSLPGFDPKSILYNNSNLDWNLDNIFQGIGKYGSYAKGILDLFNTGKSLLGMGSEDQNRKLIEQMMNWQKQKYEQSYADAQARYNDYMRKQNASKLSFSPMATV